MSQPAEGIGERTRGSGASGLISGGADRASCWRWNAGLCLYASMNFFTDTKLYLISLSALRRGRRR